SSNWIAETNNKNKRIGSGQRAFYPEAEKCLYTWIIEQRKQVNKLALRQCTKISQKLPKQTQKLLEKFYEHIAQLKSQKFFELGNILNMDETPVWFDIAGNFTVNLKSEKTVHIRAMDPWVCEINTSTEDAM
ncbi:218_t:CDS:2, partial [Gigaspora margarita]